MKNKIIVFFDSVLYWSIVLIPFTIAVGPAFTNTLIGFMLFSFLVKRIAAGKRLSISTAINLPFLFIVVFSIISFINSIDYRASVQGITKLVLHAFVFLICAAEIKDKKHLRLIIASSLLGLSLASVDAVWQMAMGKDFIRGNQPMVFIGIKRATAGFPHTNILGVYLSALVPLAVGLALFYYKGRKKALMLGLAVLGLAGLILTVSRGAALAFLVSFLFMGICRKNKTIPFLILAVLLLSPMVMPGKIKDFARSVNNDPIRFLLNDDRIQVFDNSLNMVRHHPVIGVGVNTFSKNYMKYRLSKYHYASTDGPMYAHNNFLHMAGEIGLLGMAAFIWLLFALFRQIAKTFSRLKDGYLKIAHLCLCACVVGFLINGLTETSMYYARVAMLFWFLVGTLLSFNHLERDIKA